MRLYKFAEHPGSRVALTEDPNGDNLPEGSWRPAGHVDVNRGGGPLIGADSDTILDAIDDDGIFIWS